MRTVVGVLRGGPSNEYEVSLKSGAAILNALDKEKFEPRDLFVDRQGAWHLHGLTVPPERALREVDVVFNVIHGEYGEDGSLHRILDSLAVPYTGSDLPTSQLVFNKHLTKEQVKKAGLKLPQHILVNSEGDIEAKALKVFRSFPHPSIIKPIIGGSSVGMTLADSFHSLLHGLRRGFEIAPKVMVEEYIKGKEASVGVIDHYRGERLYVLMPIEIIPPPHKPFFDYEAKYSGQSIERVPGNFTESEKQELMRAAKAAHEVLGLSHYSRSDFIVSRRGIYFLEANNAAGVGMTEESLFPKAIHAIGSRLSQFVEHVVDLAVADSMSKLAKRKCVPCEGGVDPLTSQQAQKLMPELHPEWMLIDDARILARSFTFKNFSKTMQFVNKIAEIAEEENHHPDMSISYNQLSVELTTHAVEGLSENDFILASKVDQIKL